MSHLKYSQAAVNMVAIAAEIAMYLPVPAFGYLCDRSGSRIPSILAGLFFGGGYLIAALAYRAGPPEQPAGQGGWPFWTMILAFVAIGMGTSCMYLAAVSTCAKNFGRGRSKGVALAIPIAAFGLSGMWVSQVGSRLLYVHNDDGTRGDVDVYKFFIFLAITLFVMGIIGSVALKVVDESELIEEAIDQLEQSGWLDETEFFERAAHQHGYGTMDHNDLSASTVNFLRSEAEELKKREAEERARKEWLLNAETHRFLSDHTMWWLAAGFFLITGPGEAFINNMGTIIGTLYPSNTAPEDIPTSPATHVSVIAITSTISRLFTGSVTDLLAPPADPHQHNRGPNSQASSMVQFVPTRFSVSRIWFLLTFAIMLSAGQVLLASGVFQQHGESFWIVSALIGAGYGAVFALTPIIISVVWGVENFATNWGIVATVPAAGAAVWGIVYSAVYEAGANADPVVGVPEVETGALCYGAKCYAPTFWAMAVSVWVACGLWIFAWRGPGGWKARGVAV
jgi:MFS family permease